MSEPATHPPKVSAAAPPVPAPNWVAHVVNTMPAILYVFDLDEQRPVYFNYQPLQHTGLNFAEMNAPDNRFAAEWMHPDDQPWFMAHLQQMRTAEEGQTYPLQYRVRGVDGTYRWFLSRDAPMTRNHQGMVTQIIGCSLDITDRKQIEEDSETRLREAERTLAELRAVLDQMPAGVYIGNEKGIQTANALGLEMTGFDGLDEMRHHITALSERLQTRHADTGERILPREEPFARALRGERVTHDIRYTHLKTGREMVVRTAAAPVYDGLRVIAAIAVTTDLTARIELQDALARANSIVKAVVHDTGQAIAVKDLQGRYLLCNPVTAAILGRSEADLLGKTDADLLPPAVAQALMAIDQQVMRTGVSQTVEELVPMDGSDHFFLSTKDPLRDEEGNIIGLILNARDITADKQRDQEIRDSQNRFLTLTENIPDFVWMADAAGRITYINPQWTAYTGQTLAQTRKDGGLSAIHPDDVPGVAARWQAALAEGMPYGGRFRCRRTGDDTYRWMQARSFPVRDAQGAITQWVGTTTDIHDQWEAEEENRMLTARLRRAMQETHHRVKNNLQSLAALIEIQRSDALVVPMSALDRVGQHIRTLASLHDLLTQEQKFEMEADTLSLADMLSRLMPMLQTTAAPRLIAVQSDDVILSIKQTGSLGLLISELISNAIKHGQGQISLCLRREMVLPLEQERRSYPRLCLEVSDDGPGFPPDFDSQRMARTGLELIDSIARWDLKGRVVYSNPPEGGARVTITFPLVDLH